MNLVFGHDEAVAAWAARHYRTFQPYYRALGIVNGEQDAPLIGAATFHNFNGSNVDVCYWGPKTVTIGICRGIVRFAFCELKANRITAKTQRSNRAIKLGLPPMGFRYEGVLPRYYGPKRKDDAIVFGLLREHAGKLLGPSYEP